MSRLYVLLPGVSALTCRHIVAEIVADPEDAQGAGLADSFAGPAARIMSRKELLAGEGGRRALDAWAAGEDAGFGAETPFLVLDVKPGFDPDDPDVIPFGRHRRAG